MEPEKHCLLDDESSPNDETVYSLSIEPMALQKPPLNQQMLQRIRRSGWQILLPILLGYVAGVLTLVTMGAISSHRLKLEPSYSPAQGAIQIELQQLQFPGHGEYSRFAGEPRAETDQAWHKLTAPLMIRATREEMERGGENPEFSVQLVDGEYLASTGVYHELHCLKRMRWYLYRDTYYQNLTDDQDTYLKGHIDHCIETLRILAMCHADVSLYSYEWRTHENYTRQERKSNSKQVCVRWDKLAAWMEGRSVSWDPMLIAPEP